MRKVTLYTINTTEVMITRDDYFSIYVHIPADLTKCANVAIDEILIANTYSKIDLPLYKINKVIPPTQPFINLRPSDIPKTKEYFIAIEPALAEILEALYSSKMSRLSVKLFEIEEQCKKSTEESKFWKSECERIKTQAHEEIENLNSQIEVLKNQSLKQKLVSLVKQIFNK
jgi:hypothetical protein